MIIKILLILFILVVPAFFLWVCVSLPDRIIKKNYNNDYSYVFGKINDRFKRIEDRFKKIEERFQKEDDDMIEIGEAIRWDLQKTTCEQNHKLKDIESRIDKIEKVVKVIEEYDSKESKRLMTNDEVFKLLFDMDAKKARELCCSVKENDAFNEWRNRENKNTKMLKKKYIRGN